MPPCRKMFSLFCQKRTFSCKKPNHLCYLLALVSTGKMSTPQHCVIYFVQDATSTQNKTFQIIVKKAYLGLHERLALKRSRLLDGKRTQPGHRCCYARRCLNKTPVASTYKQWQLPTGDRRTGSETERVCVWGVWPPQRGREASLSLRPGTRTGRGLATTSCDDTRILCFEY